MRTIKNIISGSKTRFNYFLPLYMQALKPFISLTDAKGNNYTMQLDIEDRKLKNGRAMLLSGTITDKTGMPVTVKIARAVNTAFLAQHVRISGNIVTTAGQIAAQLNTLFAEE